MGSRKAGQVPGSKWPPGAGAKGHLAEPGGGLGLWGPAGDRGQHCRSSKYKGQDGGGQAQVRGRPGPTGLRYQARELSMTPVTAPRTGPVVLESSQSLKLPSRDPVGTRGGREARRADSLLEVGWCMAARGTCQDGPRLAAGGWGSDGLAVQGEGTKGTGVKV